MGEVGQSPQEGGKEADGVKAEAFVRLVCQDLSPVERVIRRGRLAGFTEDEVRQAAESLGYVVDGENWVLSRPLPATDHGATAEDLVAWFPFLDAETAEGLLELMRAGGV